MDNDRFEQLQEIEQDNQAVYIGIIRACQWFMGCSVFLAIILAVKI